MELFIHGGLNKTGTSYLQVLLERNAEFLRDNGISYAYSQAGFGNAAQILYDLRRGDIARLRARLATFRQAAERTGCRRVLMSSELFYHDIVRPAHRQTLLRELTDAGFATPHLLLFFRDPAAQAISCYCHRSGIRDIGEFENWVCETFEFSRELSGFFAAIDAGLGMVLTTKPYVSDRLAAAMTEWLETPPLPNAVGQQVNRSVTADEARLLSWVRNDDPEAASHLRDKLKALDPALKLSDHVLRADWYWAARQSFDPIRADLDRLDALLGVALSGERYAGRSTTEDPAGIRLSRAQTKAVLAALHEWSWCRRSAQRLRNWIAAQRRDAAVPLPEPPNPRS